MDNYVEIENQTVKVQQGIQYEQRINLIFFNAYGRYCDTDDYEDDLIFCEMCDFFCLSQDFGLADNDFLKLNLHKSWLNSRPIGV